MGINQIEDEVLPMLEEMKNEISSIGGRGLKKGSQEAKAWGEKMRAMRGKPKETKSTKSCCKMCAGKGCYCCE